MDAVEYVKQHERMCNHYTNCDDCPAGDYEGCSSLNGIFKLVLIVEQWAKEHPVKTRQSEFLKMFPNANLDDYGIPLIAPCDVYDEERKSGCWENGCDKCRHNFWLKEIERGK